MRKLTYLFLVFFILTNCSIEKTSSIDNGINQVDSLKQKFIPIFNGVWVLTDYITEMEQSKSPKKASDKLKGVVTLIINVGINSDSIEVGASWNNHEGYNFTTYFMLGQNPNCLKTNIMDYNEKTNYYELGYEIINKETYLFLYHYNKSNILIDKKRYTKVANKPMDNDAAWGIQYIVNEKLFSGTYLLADSLNPGRKVIFSSDGSVTGLKNYNTYYVATDFNSPGPDEEQANSIGFNLNTENPELFLFDFKADTLFLLNGDFMFELVRQ